MERAPPHSPGKRNARWVNGGSIFQGNTVLETDVGMSMVKV